MNTENKKQNIRAKNNEIAKAKPKDQPSIFPIEHLNAFSKIIIVPHEILRQIINFFELFHFSLIFELFKETLIVPEIRKLVKKWYTMLYEYIVVCEKK